MATPRAADLVKQRVRNAAGALHAADPIQYVGDLIDRSFELPLGDDQYADNTLTPGAAPFEPSFSEREPDDLRFTLEPLGPGHAPATKRDEATREMRRLVGTVFGRHALRWFDQVSEEFRGHRGGTGLDYGAWFGSSYNADGLSKSKVYYELSPGLVQGLAPATARLVRVAGETLPGLVPVFTTISCSRDVGTQRVTFVPTGTLRLKDLEPLMRRLGSSHQLPGLMQMVGLVLGGRFELPTGTCMVALAQSPEGTELKLEIVLGAIPDLPVNFLDLVVMGLSERPRQLQALARWMRAFTPDQAEWPGNFSVLSIRTTPSSPARMSLYLRPVELEILPQASDHDGPRLAVVG
jgi:hypothetical protein